MTTFKWLQINDIVRKIKRIQSKSKQIGEIYWETGKCYVW